MTDNIILTIMIPVYNQEDLILKALDSIPKRNDVQILITDDCSTDNTWSIIEKWTDENYKNFYNVTSQRNRTNRGCGYSKNLMYTLADGKYIVTLDSDDYLYTDKYNEIIDRLYTLDKDMIFIANDINDGAVWSNSDRKATWSYFVRNDFLKSTGLNYNPEARRAGDFELTKSLQQLHPKEMILTDVVYHYNYPREGSIVWKFEHGVE